MNKILDCEEDINSNYGMRMHLLFFNTDQSDCTDSSFCDPHHKQVKKTSSKYWNYREPQTINFCMTLIEKTTALDTWIESTTLKTK